MGDVDGGNPLGVEEVAHVDAQSVAQVAVESAEGLVEEQQSGTRGEGSSEGDSLSFSAGQSGDVTLSEAGQPHKLEELRDAGAALPRGLVSQAEGHVALDVSMREEQRILED